MGSRGRRGSWMAVIALVSLPAGAWAQKEAAAPEAPAAETEAAAAVDVRVSEGVRLYESAELPEAKAVLSRALADGGLSDADTKRARRYLAAALLAGGDLSGARAVLVELFQADLTAEVSPEIFVPALVTLAEEARHEVEADHAATHPDPDPVKPPDPVPPDPGTGLATTPPDPDPGIGTPPIEVPPPEPPKASRAFALRVGVFGLSELSGPSVGAGAAIIVGYKGIELSPRLLLGEHIGGEMELAYAILAGNVQPRIGVRATYVPDAGWGGGQFVGVRVGIAGGLELTADAGVAFFDTDSEFRSFGILLNFGIGYRVMGL